MVTFISILRGINVGGTKKIRMTDLKSLFEGLGFDQVVTYIQSGNVVFNAQDEPSEAKISVRIEEGLVKKYNFQVPVILRTLQEMQVLMEENPLVSEKGVDPEKLHVTLLSDFPRQEDIDSLLKVNFSPDRYILRGKNIFLYCPGGYGKTKLSNAFFENKLKVKTSTRNWRTMQKLLELATDLNGGPAIKTEPL